MIFKSEESIEIHVKGIYQYITSNPNGISDDKVIFTDGTTGNKLTYGEFKSYSKKFAAGLIDNAGFKREDVLAIVSPNKIDWIIVLFGTLAAGGTATFVNPMCTVEEFTYQLQGSGTKYIVAFPSLLSNTIKAAADAGIPKSNIFSFGEITDVKKANKQALADLKYHKKHECGKEGNRKIAEEFDGIKPYSSLMSEREAIPVEYSPEEATKTTAYLWYSSGTTTGLNKGIEMTHSNIVSNLAQVRAYDDEIDSDTIFIGVLPFFHAYGLFLLIHVTLLNGASLVTMPATMSEFDPSEFYRLIQDYKVNVMPIVPPLVLLLVKSQNLRNYDLSSLRLCISAAAPLSKELAKEFTNTFHVPIKQRFGTAEAILTHLFKKSDNVVGSIGKLVPNVECKIISEQGKELGYNQQGELCIRGPSVMKGYLNNKEATDACIDSEGWYHTGDVAKVDESGYFYIVDRLKEMIKCWAHPISPAELESILLTHPSIADAAVVGVVADQVANEFPAAYVVLKSDTSPSNLLKEEIKAFVAQGVGADAFYKELFGGVFFIDKIPKSVSGKILRRVLRDKIKKEHRFFSKQY